MQMPNHSSREKIGTQKLKRFGMAIVCLFLVGFGAANILAYRHAHAMMNFSDHHVRGLKLEEMSVTQKIKALFLGVDLSRPSSNVSHAELADNCQSISIPTIEISSIGAWYCPAKNGQRLAILFHGYLMDKSSLIEEAKILLQAQYSVLLVDFRGSWESSDSYTTIGYFDADDVAAAVNYAQQHFPHEKVVLYGQSMGAAAIFRAVHSHQISADAIIVEAIFDRLLSTVKNRFHILGVPAFPGAHILVFWGGLQAGFNGFLHNPADYARSVKIPTLFLHGENDDRAKLQDTYTVYEKVPAAKHLSVFPDTVHESHLARHPEKWEKDIMAFLAAYI